MKTMWKRNVLVDVQVTCFMPMFSENMHLAIIDRLHQHIHLKTFLWYFNFCFISSVKKFPAAVKKERGRPTVEKSKLYQLNLPGNITHGAEHTLWSPAGISPMQNHNSRNINYHNVKTWASQSSLIVTWQWHGKNNSGRSKWLLHCFWLFHHPPSARPEAMRIFLELLGFLFAL